MTEIGEMIAVPTRHTEPSPECPFCPMPEPIKYKTYAGAKNDSKVLADVMKSPGKLTSLQSGARPQTGKVDSDGYRQEQQAPDPRPVDDSKFYTHQAHHLISGNQALKGSPMEDWILASSKNKGDTGYSVNCTGNGFWAPSVPKDYKGKWSAKKKVLNDAERQIEAEKVMKDAAAQIHIGPHNISDPDDPEGDKHKSYDSYIKDKLKAIANRIQIWAPYCPYCDNSASGKPQATHKVHDILDRLSKHLEMKIKGSPKVWDIFISKYALEYHKPVCTHKRKKK